ncbi:MAG: lamin tail domain-containing protein [Myxococcales bacterium]|nr:lamin tail domain-containing protein [Myxococcales bacterium]
MNKMLFTSMLCLIAACACSESNSASPNSGGSSGSGATGGGATGGAGGSGNTGGSGATGGSAGSNTGGSAGQTSDGGAGACGYADGTATSNLAINEISAKGDDFVEIVNLGSVSADLSGMVLADQDDTGCPKLTEALTFPSGTSLAAGERLLIVAGQTGASNDPQTDCLNGPASCFHVGFGISASNGDGVFLISTTTIVASAALPIDAVTDGQTWCRLPDGTGDFAVCAPTPGAANAAP